MKRTLLIVLALLCAILARPAQSQDSPDLEKVIVDLESKWAGAQKDGKVDVVGPLLADRFIAVGTDGKLATKDELLARVKPGKWEDDGISDVKVIVYGHIAVATGLWTGKGQVGDHKVGHPQTLDRYLGSHAWRHLAVRRQPANRNQTIARSRNTCRARRIPSAPTVLEGRCLEDRNTSPRTERPKPRPSPGRRGFCPGRGRIRAPFTLGRVRPRCREIFEFVCLAVLRQKILDLYNQHISERIWISASGTGFFLDRCRFPSSAPTLALFDLNSNSLATTAKRLRRYTPSCHFGRCAPAYRYRCVELSIDTALTILLHCLPGNLQSKSVVFEHVKPLLRDGGVVFGSTILGEAAQQNFLAAKLMKAYNARGFFSNVSDRRDDLRPACTAVGRLYDPRRGLCGAVQR